MKYTIRQWVQAFDIYAQKTLCKWGVHGWIHVVIDGMAFRKCGHCGKFKDEGDE